MSPLNEEQYNLLNEKYSVAIELAKQGMLANGIDALIPMYEELTGQKMRTNCSDCKMDMMILFVISMKAYEYIRNVTTTQNIEWSKQDEVIEQTKKKKKKNA
jgi:hypothetical protein